MISLPVHSKGNSLHLLTPSSQSILKKEEKSQIDNLTHHLNELEKEEQTKPKVGRRKEIIKIKEEINKIKIKKIRQNQSNQELVL